MSELIEDTNPRDLRELLGQIDAKETALPDFQRDFVWDPKMTQELIVSIAHSYPAGSLLRIRDSGRLFASREFQGAPPLDGAHPTYLVLDGQQRLTSLYQAFYGVGDQTYFIDVGKLIQGKEFDEAIFHLRVGSPRARELAAFETQASKLVAPLSLLHRGTGEFHRWAAKVSRRLAGDDRARTELDDKLRDVADRWFEPISDYRFPVVTLSAGTSTEAVCTIFETLNRTGVKLSPFELLSARFWPKDVNLRTLWARAQLDFQIIEDFGVDPYYSLQAIALVARPSPSVKRGDVLELEPKQISDWWDKVAIGLAKTLQVLRDDCGVLTPNWLPYNTIVVPMAAVFASSGVINSPEEAPARRKMTRWFWCSVFGQTYENTPTGQSAKDYTELLAWLRGGAEPASVSGFSFDPVLLIDTTVRQRALYDGVICSILAGGPRDFHTGGRITIDLMARDKVDDHHVFPQDYLRRKGISQALIDSVLNKTLIDKATNLRISNRAPSDYLGQMAQSMSVADFDALLDSHLLPAGKGSPLLADDYDAFLNARRQILHRRITSLTAG